MTTVRLSRPRWPRTTGRRAARGRRCHPVLRQRAGAARRHPARCAAARSPPSSATTAPASPPWSAASRASTHPTPARSTSTGQACTSSHREDAREAGIETVHQNLALVEDLTVWQNLFLNREIVRGSARRPARPPRHAAQSAQEMVSTLAVNVPAVELPGAPALRRPASGRGHLPGRGFQLQARHHGRADRRPGRAGDRPRRGTDLRLRDEGHASC